MARKSEKKTFGIESIEIERFRNFNPMTIRLGSRITAISGQNGTGKSTILGMLGQPFGLDGATDLFGRVMRTKYLDVLKISPKYDLPGSHLYYVNLVDPDLYVDGVTHVQVKSFERKQYKIPIRFVTGAKRTPGYGNVDYPVMYLGMKRTYPIGEIANPVQVDTKLTEEEQDCFTRWYSQVFIEWDDDSMSPVQIEASTAGKRTVLVNSSSYDYLTNSAGQDNLGQILAALISFGRLKSSMGDTYKGGLLLIDELDATLFPASQTELLKLLWREAEALMLQIVFTTHSLSLIEDILDLKRRGGVELVYLRRLSSGVDMVDAPAIEDIRADLRLTFPKKRPEPKAEVWCEDAEAKWLMLKMLPRNLSRKSNIIAAKLGCGELRKLSANDNIASLADVTFVVDGDGLNQASNKERNSKRLLVLPTDDLSPEESIYQFLCDLPDDDPFWTMHYGKKTFQREFHDMSSEKYGDGTPWEHKSGPKKREFFKSWFNAQKSSKKWGENGDRLYAAWKVGRGDEIDEFVRQFERKTVAALRRMEAREAGKFKQ